MSVSENLSKNLFLGTALLISFGIVSAGPIDIEVISPQNNTEITQDSIGINATVDPGADTVNRTRYYLYNDDTGEEEKGNVSFNDSIDVEGEMLDSGNYNLSFQVQDDSGDYNQSYINFSLDTGGEEGPPGEESGLEIDDQKASTRDGESPNIAFLGNALNVQNGNISTTYNLTNFSKGTTIIDGHNVTNDPISTSFDGREGRYTLFDENNSDNNVSIDLVRNDSDVTGRVNTTNLQNVSINYWLNGSSVNESYVTRSINNSWSGTDSLFKMNISSSISKFWINVSTSAGNKFVEARGAQSFRRAVSMPRVNDVNILEGSATVEGYVTDDDTNANPNNLKLRLRTKKTGFGSFYPSRQPKVTVPPTKYTYTNSSGYYNFTGLKGKKGYFVDVVNRSHARVSFQNPLFSNSGEVQPVPGETSNITFNVTQNTNNVSLEMIGNTGSNIRYGFIVSGSSASFMKPLVEPNQEINVTVPNAASYSITAAKFVDSGGFFPSILFDDAFVTFAQADTTSETQKLGFPTLVTINGTVEDGDGNPVEDAQVFAENQSEGAFFSGRTNSNGVYTVKVRNQTNYSLTVEPGFRSELSRKNKSISVPENKTNDFSLSTGPYIEGYFNASGSGVEDVRINAWNGSKNSYGFTETQSNGYYKIGGLEDQTNYTLYAESPPGYPDEQKSGVTALTDGNWSNFTTGTELYDLNGTIKSDSGSRLNATVQLLPTSSGPVLQNKTVNGSYGFSQADSGSYRVRVNPENNSYSKTRTQITLDSDRQIDFNLTELNTVSGYVKSNSTDNPLSDVLVQAENLSANSLETDRTDSSGFYSINVPNISHKIELYPPRDSDKSFNTSSFNTSHVGGERNFTLYSGVYLDGTVRNPGVQNLSGYINIWNSSAGVSRYKQFSGGVYNITGLDSDVGYNIFVSVENSSYGSNRTTISSTKVPGTLDFTFRELQGPEVWVTVKDTANTPLENATVTLNGTQKSTNPKGIAKFDERVDTSRAVIVATKGNYNTSREEITAKTNYTENNNDASRGIQNETVYINSSLGNFRDVSLNITNSGSNVTEATVVASSNATGRNAADITDNDGEATLNDILPGLNYVVSVSSDSNFEAFNISLGKGDSSVKSGSKVDIWYEVPQ